jgi:hypothetical protein
MTTEAEWFSRTAKIFADSGEAVTLAGAEAILDSYRLQVAVGDVGNSIAHQAAVLTVVNSAVRAFRGGVDIHVPTDCRLSTGWYGGMALSAAVVALGAHIVGDLSADHVTICVGDPLETPRGAVVLRVVVRGWSAGVVEGCVSPVVEEHPFVLSGIAAGGIAVAEAFEWRRGSNVLAGRRSNGISLWRPDAPWLSKVAEGPDDVTYAPSAWWVVGLGHLGQGYLWSIGMLPYADMSGVRLMLQDDDVVSAANESTGLLLVPGSTSRRGRTRKTRLLAERLEERGFRTAITERRLAPGDGPRGDEPHLALVGVDNPDTRRALSSTNGFELIVDGGLGGGPVEYLDLSVHTFPASRLSTDIRSWSTGSLPAPPGMELPAYAERTARTGDECGTVEIAGRSVAASFVGATAGALVIAEGIRCLRGDHRHEVLTTSLRDLDTTAALPADAPGMGSVGYIGLA